MFAALLQFVAVDAAVLGFNEASRPVVDVYLVLPWQPAWTRPYLYYWICGTTTANTENYWWDPHAYDAIVRMIRQLATAVQTITRPRPRGTQVTLLSRFDIASTSSGSPTRRPGRFERTCQGAAQRSAGSSG